ncbi:hypothetical protein ARMSODRAFT_981591 [Armillaria solidipes]|uniref:Uncharacterized protein n=1 Tax=Armillaria solidipes TaxID=1076256 RepID=A0A2H3B5F6_9AGAR|nr:hypothetical protein ARMSODRAFT_981591 [Armillaria solidipes]
MSKGTYLPPACTGPQFLGPLDKIIKEGFKRMWSALRQRWGTRRVTEARGNIPAGEIINPHALNIGNADFGSRDWNIPSNDMRNSAPAVTTAEEGDVLASVDADKKELSVNENINAVGYSIELDGEGEDTLSETMMEQAARVWRTGLGPFPAPRQILAKSGFGNWGDRHGGTFTFRREIPTSQSSILRDLLCLGCAKRQDSKDPEVSRDVPI